MKKPPPTAIRLRGIRYTTTVASPPKVWLDNKLLNLEKSLKIKSYNIQGFSWGNDAKGASQLALAICSELYPKEMVVPLASCFRAIFLDKINDENFDLTLDLEAFNEEYLGQLV